MKKIFTLIIVTVLCVATLFAQAPEKFSYQAVVRNASNALVTNAQVGVRVSILQGSATGNAVYVETQVATTNANGLLTVEIGGGSVLQGSFTGIDWANGLYFLKTETDPTGGNSYTVTSTQQLLSVPYALYAKDAGNTFSGDYNDLINTPTIPTVPTDISVFNNDAGYITAAQVPEQVNADWNATTGAAQILNKPTLFSGDYNDLSNKPTIPSVPTSVSAFYNDAGYLTNYTETDPLFTSWDKDYNDLINKPNLSSVAYSGSYNDLFNKPAIPTTVGELTNNVGYITLTQVPAQVNADWNATTGAAQILNKPILFSGSYDDLTNKPNLSSVAYSGSYNDLLNKPAIPTTVGELTNNMGYITLSQVPAQVNADWNATTGAAQILNKPTLFSGSYNDLTNKPIIPSVPTNVSAFYNDAGYLTGYTETDPLFNAWNKDYNDLINLPQIPQIPADVSAFNNDAGYITAQDIPVIPTVPTNVSAFTNDAGYITSADVQAAAGIPTNVSAFTNDAGYITANDVPAQVNADWNATSGVAMILNKPTLFSGNYNDLSNKPTIPAAANNATLTIQRNGSSVGTFSANASTNSTINIAVPTTTSELTNNSGFITEAELNVLLAAMNNTIDSLRSRIEDLENGETPVIPDPENPDTTITPGTSFIMDGLACPGTPTVTDYDGIEYPTVAIGQQCWMKENLRSMHYADGTPITLIENGTTTSSTARYCYHAGGNASNDYPYGLVYNWPAVMYGGQSYNVDPSNVRGVCPTGWHVPSNAEWTKLRTYVGGQSQYTCDGNANNIAKALASTTNWTSNSIQYAVGDYAPNNNLTGFSALPAGDNSGNVGQKANFWSCFQTSSTQAYAFQLESTSAGVAQNGAADKSTGYSVRCVRDSAVAVGDAQMVVTGNVGSITTSTASCSGTVNTNNSLQVTERGVCWSQMPNPNITDPIPTVVGGHTSNSSGTGSFTVSITGLQPGTTYYVRAYVTTNAGTVYGNTVTFTTQSDTSACGTATITDRDGNSYPTVKIGNQCWMKENLRTKHYADGTGILSGSTYSGTVAYYYTPANGYGLLYNWPAVMHGASTSSTNPSGVRGICPIGWHVPSDTEWDEMKETVRSNSAYRCNGDENNIAKALASQTGWNSSTNDCAVGNEPTANNATGFGALPAGGYYNNVYLYSGDIAHFWSATEGASGKAWCRYLDYDYATLDRSSVNKGYRYSVRCLRD